MLSHDLKERFVQHMFLISESFVADLLAELLTREDCAAYQGIFFNHLIGTDACLSTRDLGFSVSRHAEHQGFAEINLMAKRKSEVLFIEPLFFKPHTEENCVALLIETLDACYKDCTHRALYVLTLTNRLDYWKKIIHVEDRGSPDGREVARVEFALWDEILASFRDPTRRPAHTAISETGTARLQSRSPRVKGSER